MGEDRTVEFGVNLNNREPLIAPGYGMPELLDLSQHVEELVQGVGVHLGRAQLAELNRAAE